jgi:hypothetical protein
MLKAGRRLLMIITTPTPDVRDRRRQPRGKTYTHPSTRQRAIGATAGNNSRPYAHDPSWVQYVIRRIRYVSGQLSSMIQARSLQGER